MADSPDQGQHTRSVTCTAFRFTVLASSGMCCLTMQITIIAIIIIVVVICIVLVLVNVLVIIVVIQVVILIQSHTFCYVYRFPLCRFSQYFVSKIVRSVPRAALRVVLRGENAP